MLSRSISRLSSDFAHKQVNTGFSKKYGDNFDRIFGKKSSNQKSNQAKAPAAAKDQQTSAAAK
jgi:hypothetical protein